MLEPWIIEQIRRREEERRRGERPQLELPVEETPWPTRNDSDGAGDAEIEPDPREPKRGVVIINLSGS